MKMISGIKNKKVRISLLTFAIIGFLSIYSSAGNSPNNNLIILKGSSSDRDMPIPAGVKTFEQETLNSTNFVDIDEYEKPVGVADTCRIEVNNSGN